MPVAQGDTVIKEFSNSTVDARIRKFSLRTPDTDWGNKLPDLRRDHGLIDKDWSSVPQPNSCDHLDTLSSVTTMKYLSVQAVLLGYFHYSR